MTRQEHMQWCKNRALEYCDRGEVREAFNSMISDLGKHEETCGHPAIMLGVMQIMNGFLSTSAEMREFIEGFY